uniref:Rho-GAP domain-containing protein n=1 Tax=Eucampia antarctica TaxID=49252 RepID=A0A7S2VYZ6_9STRA|mmetsp:Transcript_10850/g.10359  ORF Transcript_10850/g.10359 Transcript_10850/m.10359 type:complete len:866 (+) Transcript_10850:208-2805(+)|eukprot:CAMPEP_0197829166 /NCGR_PEP_ID=MMETSP1437-20131217/5617_1 /TAXON_ID=49252 ORGANISM="Eucampia antarctica, Strain CCMP1452" /NCGR_SAMPLE_ID=MMETSP1437 /ASSEMBLY_ACC=CAM_ASM_001096 /LENGTH=865 /DNA_ID=CAMNT_0043430691 /DNA_START=192 /DNA_END=2789 /DNA_ORIENTATION=+
MGEDPPSWAAPTSQQQYSQQPQQHQNQNHGAVQNSGGHSQQPTNPNSHDSNNNPQQYASTPQQQQERVNARPNHNPQHGVAGSPSVSAPRDSVASTAAPHQQPSPSGSVSTGARRKIGSSPNDDFTNQITTSIVAPRSADEEMEDGRIRNREAVTKIRDAWIYKQIRARQDEFTQYKQARIFFGTWNVNAKGKDESLESWLCKDWGKNGEYAPDIVAVGFQEMVDLNAVNVTVDKNSLQRTQHWQERILETLNSKKNANNDPMRAYKSLEQKFLVGLLLCVYVKAQHRQRVKYIIGTTVSVGLMGMMGNKGAVSIRLQFYDSTICIVNAHLAAHRENTAGRNADFHNIIQKLRYDIGDEAVKEVIRSGSLSQWATGNSFVTLADHDLSFWMGDLNYRVDESISTENVIALSEKGHLDQLIANDQLNIERAAGRVFNKWDEGSIDFKPTYKYQPGTDSYDKRPDKKIRAPAWCDRVLWLAQEPSHVAQLSYTRSELNISDHKPVMSTFAITIKDVVKSKREEVFDEVMKLLDRFENQTLPMVGLDRLNLDFGEIRYDEKITLPIKVTNTGKVVAQFRLVPKSEEETTLCKEWMTVSPTYGMLIPGEKEAIINFTLSIDNKTAQALNSGREVLEDIIILRLENGRDYYITVTGKYARSCFGMSVDELVMYSQPIRSIPLDPLKRAESQAPSETAALCVPKELWRIVDAIYEKGLHEPDLFSTPGLVEEIYMLRECLDNGTPFAEFRIHSMAEVLLSFLSHNPSPIVPQSLFPTLDIDSQNIQSVARKFLEELPPIHYNIFVYIISFFRECLLYRESNKLSVAKAARICNNCLVVGNTDQAVEESAATVQRRSGMLMIMIHFLDTNTI